MRPAAKPPSDRDFQDAFKVFLARCEEERIGASALAPDRWRVHGKRVVTWWPFSRNKTAKIDGIYEVRKGATLEEVISWARGGDVRPVEKQRGLCNEAQERDYD